MTENEFEKSMTHPGYWADNSILTISLEDDKESSSHMEKVPHILFTRIFHHLLLIITLVISGCIVIISVVLLHVFDANDLSTTAHNLLLLVRYAGLYSFSGGLATYFSIEFVVLLFGRKLFLNRIHQRRIKSAKHLLQNFLLSIIFNEKFLRQYLKRAENSLNCEFGQSTVSFVESRQFDDWINTKWQSLLESPEGMIVDSFGINLTALKIYFRTTLLDVIYEFQQQQPSPDRSSKEFDSTFFRKHISNVLTEKLSSPCDNQVHSLLVEMAHLYIDHIIVVTCLLMAVFGVLIGSISIFI